jgi:phosphatidylglycerophosphate synthase
MMATLHDNCLYIECLPTSDRRAIASIGHKTMFDARLRPLINGPLDALARPLHAKGVGADLVTVASCAIGLLAALAIGIGYTKLALVLIAANRIGDGLDGAIARLSGPTDRGAFLDITLDFVFYASIPLAFAIADPANNAVAAAALLAAFLVNGTTFLAFATLAAKRGLSTKAQGHKSIYYLAGIAEGGETIAAFSLVCLFPTIFPKVALLFAALTAASAIARMIIGWRALD